MGSKHDQVLLKILRDVSNVTNFLDAIFGFLYRCTDFYVDAASEQKLGFPTGSAEKLVVTSFRKWRNGNFTSAIGTTKVIQNSEASGIARNVKIVSDKKLEKDYVAPVQLSDSYNGAVRENYTWSQTISDVDVFVKISPCVKTIGDLKVDVSTKEIRIAERRNISTENNNLRGDVEDSDVENSKVPEWTIVLGGELTFKIKKEESVWSMVPGEYVSIHLEKISERWWEALIVGEPNIELNKIDCSRHFDELGASEQMKVQELMWNHRQKLLGKATSDQTKMEKILEKAWNAKGSPLKGTVYDPSVLHFN